MATIVPAYGRDYKTAEEAEAAWEAGVDFKTQSVDIGFDRYINLTDAKNHGLARVVIRYNKLQNTVIAWMKP